MCCIHTYIHIYILYLRNSYIQYLSKNTCIQIYVSIYKYIYVCMYVHKNHVPICVCMYVYI